MKNFTYLFLGLSLTAITWGACQKETTNNQNPPTEGKTLQLPLTQYDYNAEVVNRSFSRNGILSSKANLGRVLFYDVALSVSNSVACASCHSQSRAFSDMDALSAGFTGEATKRNSMALFNLGSNGKFFWDMRRTNLEEMVLDPAVHLVEMGMESREKIADKLNQIPYYQTLFKQVYGTQDATVKNIEESLSLFLLSIVSGSARFDQVNNGHSAFTPQESRGFNIFVQSQCFRCHGGDNFNNQGFNPNGKVFLSNKGGSWGSGGGSGAINSTADFANIGLEYDYPDAGMSPEAQLEVGVPDLEQGLFKIPSLRNIAITGPYMHDGRFATLMDVLNHYDHGVKAHKNLDARLLDGHINLNTGEFEGTEAPRRLNLSPQDKEDLIAFLHTLTDYQLITDPKYSNPFK